MVDFHKKNNADCTIAVLEVPWEEASRFGILATNDDDRIYEFAEKPKEPKSNKASMGVYVFSWDKLKKYLIQDENTEGSANDFGKNIIPTMLEAGERLFAFPFAGYWKDVGTIDSLWEANLDIINPNVDLDGSNTAYTVFMIIGIIGYFTIPTVAGWIIQAGGMGSYNRSINNTAMTGGSWAGSVAGGVAGNVAGRVGKLLK